MTRARGELPEPEEALLGIERPSIEDEEAESRRADELKELRKAGIRAVMGQEWFRAWLMEFLTDWQCFGNPLAVSPGGFPDPMATQFYMGKKAAAWELWAQLDDVAPDLASLMRREAAGKA